MNTQTTLRRFTLGACALALGLGMFQAQADDGALYGPKAPKGSAFVRAYNAGNAELDVNVGEVQLKRVAPLGSSDFASYLLQAQASRAQIVGLANAGGDTVNAIKAASEFGLTKGGQKMAGLLLYINDIHAIGLQAAAGLTLTEAFYWDMNDQTRAWSQRYYDKLRKMPNMSQAGTYSSVMHYLKAVKAAGTDDGKAVAAKMREMPVDDFFAANAKIRDDGRLVHDMYLVEVKRPEESKGAWDYYKVLRTIPGEQAAQPLAQQRLHRAGEIQQTNEHEGQHVGRNREGQHQRPVQPAPAGKLAEAGQPGQTHTQQRYPHADADHQRQGIADQPRQLGLPEVRPDLPVHFMPARQQHQQRHKHQQRDGKGDGVPAGRMGHTHSKTYKARRPGQCRGVACRRLTGR